MMMTKRDLRAALGFTIDRELCQFFDCSRAVVSSWPENGPMPSGRVWQAVARRPEAFWIASLRPAPKHVRNAGLEHVAASMDALVDEMLRPPLVRLVDGFFEFYLDGVMVYDICPIDPGHALRWVEIMAQKAWVTKGHLEQFARMAATAFNQGHK